MKFIAQDGPIFYYGSTQDSWWKFANYSKAAAAAKINAQIQAKKGIQHVDVPPIRTVCLPIRVNGFDIGAMIL